MNSDKTLRLVLGNQLFPISTHNFAENETVFMCEDLGLCSDVKHHKSKIALFFSAMRSFRDELEKNKINVIYYDYSNDFETDYCEKLIKTISSNGIKKIVFFEIEDKLFEKKVLKSLNKHKIHFEQKTTPMFIDDRDSFNDFCNEKDFLLQANYYKRMRRRLDILMEGKKPVGGKWSFDEQNRKKLPKNYDIPSLPKIKPRDDFKEISLFIEKKFSHHPGQIDVIFPYTHAQAEDWLNDFLERRFNDFGPYEDAITKNEHFQLHSMLSMSLNMGLLTPTSVVKQSLNYAEKNNIPINSLEGFIRQVIGWREFIRGVYWSYSEKMIERNFWNHSRKLSDNWYDATTGIAPLDDAILATEKFGYTHHINRLMVNSGIMNMSRIHPDEIFRWFMEMFVDSADWVMVPNVYGMGTFSDGGIFATKPYICGSSYIMRMSNFKKGDWCEIVDGLYWKFISDNKDFFTKNPRLSLMVRALDKLDLGRKRRIFNTAEEFIHTMTK